MGRENFFHINKLSNIIDLKDFIHHVLQKKCFRIYLSHNYEKKKVHSKCTYLV